MIAGIGVDIMLISRMDKSIQSETFINRVFSEQERDYINSKTNKAQTAAGMFCAKEAFLKAKGKGIGSIALKEIEVLHKPSGQPYIQYNTNKKTHLSISHMGDMAIAQVVLEE